MGLVKNILLGIVYAWNCCCCLRFPMGIDEGARDDMAACQVRAFVRLAPAYGSNRIRFHRAPLADNPERGVDRRRSDSQPFHRSGCCWVCTVADGQQACPQKFIPLAAVCRLHRGRCQPSPCRLENAAHKTTSAMSHSPSTRLRTRKAGHLSSPWDRRLTVFSSFATIRLESVDSRLRVGRRQSCPAALDPKQTAKLLTLDLSSTVKRPLKGRR